MGRLWSKLEAELEACCTSPCALRLPGFAIAGAGALYRDGVLAGAAARHLELCRRGILRGLRYGSYLLADTISAVKSGLG